MDLKITGLQEVQRRLSNLSREIIEGAFPTALTRSSEVIADEVRTRTPEGPEGLLKSSVQTQTEIDATKQRGNAAIGFTSQAGENGIPQDHVAEWVECGHHLVGHKPGEADLGQVAMHPFMRPAFAVSADKAIDAFGEAITEYLDRKE
jgi:hypothetical protein